MVDEQDVIKLPDESPLEGDSSEDWPTVRARKIAAACERADRTIAEMRARRQARLEGQLEAYELGQRIREAVDGPGVTMSVEEALAMLEGFGQTRQ